jgi:hypothetical protein
MLDKYGYIHRARKTTNGEYLLQAEDDSAPPLQYIGPGRPLGFHVIDDGKALLVCDSLKGLLRVELGPTGAITVLANSLSASSSGAGPQLGGNSHIINYANDLDVAKDGTIFFSSSTASAVMQHQDGFYDTMRSFLLNMCCGDHTGRLLAYDPSTADTREIVSGLWYANGVTIAHDEKSVLVRRRSEIPLRLSPCVSSVDDASLWYVHVFLAPLFLIRWWRRWDFVSSDTGGTGRRRGSQRLFLGRYLDFQMASPVVSTSHPACTFYRFWISLACLSWPAERGF